MAIKWTREQQQVIDLRDRNILVSAAAGSGKTAVLVERIITRLTRDENPLNVDELLIVTFTEAAAAEMKERILAAIEKALEETPENEHLQRQATLIHNAMITTIHSFCLSVIRDHFHAIDLDPGFRIAEEGELKLLKHDVLEELLEKKYQEASDSFLGFVERFATGKNDKNLEDIILKLHEYARSYPKPDEWIQDCINQYRIEGEDAQESALMKRIYDYAMDNWSAARELLLQAKTLCREEDGPAVYEKTLEEDLVLLEQLLQAEDLNEMYRAAANLSWPRLASNRNKETDPMKAELVKDARNQVKAIAAELKKKFLFSSPEEMLGDIASCAPVVQEFMEIVSEFGNAFQKKKAQKCIIDFSDMEQFALQILTEYEEGIHRASLIAEEYQNRFAEVMIDEYQDSNLIQETVLRSVSRIEKGIYNIFMVGDVKQSIYSFRLSRPALFMEKYRSYTRLDEEHMSKEEDLVKEQRIDLFQNFRSRREVIEGCNYVFYQIMRGDLGGIQYDSQSALYLGAAYEEKPDNATELLVIHTDEVPEEPENTKVSARELEARAVARRIKELVGHHQVRDKNGTYRQARYSDIVILTRSLAGWSDLYGEVLAREGVPSYTGSREGYFETREISLLLNYLRVLDNPNQDIPLTSVLTSVFGGMTSEELAIIRSTYGKMPFYEAVQEYAKETSEGNVALSAKVRACLEQIESFRRQVPYKAIHELLWLLLSESGYLDYVTALPGGQQRRSNVEMLLEKAITFESTSYKGLFNFIRYIEQLQKYEMDFGEANVLDEKADTVRIMSIHKSKGLEFPIVFIIGMSKQFNLMDQRSAVVLHPEMGVGVDAIDLEHRTRIPTIYKKQIQHDMEAETKGEELRILYVAMTRAKEKLIMVGSVKKFEHMIEGLRWVKNQTNQQLSYTQLFTAKSYMEWMMMALCHHPCFDLLWESVNEEPPIFHPLHKSEADIIIRQMKIEDLVVLEVQEETADMWTRNQLEELNIHEVYDETFKEQLEEQFEYTYPYEFEEKYKMKFTVSELKKRVYMEEEPGEILIEESKVTPLIPRFMAESEIEKGQGAFRGTAYHRFMELLDFSNTYDLETLQQYVRECREKHLMTSKMTDCINLTDVIRFLDTDIAKRMKKAAEQNRLYVEQPFVLGVPARRIYHEDSDELVLVQGIIDVYFEEDDGLVVLDYKTDYIHAMEELKERYHAQLEYYGDALLQLTGKPVKDRLIYSFTLQDVLEV